MKSLFSKPISSPNRTEKFPPPLMRFLRSNVGSKSSRARTRASPMFMRKNKNNVAIEKTQEPSSPKVTCIGQVRVRRSSNNTTKKHQQRQRIEEKKTPKQQHAAKWVCCFPFGYCVKKVESAQKVQKIVTTNAEIAISESEENENGYADSNFNPPKNALILSRCRSAPYRSSSLASKFWGSPLNSQNPQNNIRELEEEQEEPPPVLEKPIIGDLGSRKSHGNEEMQSSINEESSKACVHPLLLTRCKSEPATTGERLNPRRFSDTSPLS
ncbi:hypothetical protein H5410_044846 [Solanum commersonii]|uniref:Uncharacterized protein n=1 Tax=Solanum commersonii TaxID=4109 RepID=A0A9J5XB31_SOLCO|nr:hypothetical protein H5410_044846 [Solanum commersonii]